MPSGSASYSSLWCLHRDTSSYRGLSSSAALFSLCCGWRVWLRLRCSCMGLSGTSMIIVRSMWGIISLGGIILIPWRGWRRVPYVSSLFFISLFDILQNWMTDWTVLGNCWKTAFALELVNTIFYLWMMIMSWQVNRDVYDWFDFMSFVLWYHLFASMALKAI